MLTIGSFFTFENIGVNLKKSNGNKKSEQYFFIRKKYFEKKLSKSFNYKMLTHVNIYHVPNGVTVAILPSASEAVGQSGSQQRLKICFPRIIKAVQCIV